MKRRKSNIIARINRDLGLLADPGDRRMRRQIAVANIVHRRRSALPGVRHVPAEVLA